MINTPKPSEKLGTGQNSSVSTLLTWLRYQITSGPGVRWLLAQQV